MTVDELKTYLRIDNDEEDDLLSSLLTAAESYIKQTTGKTLKGEADISTDELYCVCVKLMVSHWYENRAAQVVGAVINDFDYSVKALIRHIAICGDYS